MDSDGITRLAALAKLDITNDERARFAAQLTDILRYVEQVRGVETSGIEDAGHPLPMADAWRDDEARPSLDRADALANAPDADRDAGLFRVPKVIG